MGYFVSAEQISSITDVELAFSTTRLLPAWEDIPKAYREGNLYTELAEAIFFGREMPRCGIELHDGIESQALNRCVRAHLQSFEPKHEHKIAGVGYLMAQACTLHPHVGD